MRNSPPKQSKKMSVNKTPPAITMCNLFTPVLASAWAKYCVSWFSLCSSLCNMSMYSCTPFFSLEEPCDVIVSDGNCRWCVVCFLVLVFLKGELFYVWHSMVSMEKRFQTNGQSTATYVEFKKRRLIVTKSTQSDKCQIVS